MPIFCGSPAVERQGIGYIADDQRHGRPINQFTIRFAPVIYLAAVFVGATGIPMGLGLAGSLIAILLGNVLGSVCTAVCAVMGPRLGMPQLAMGRSSFGYHGNYVPAFLALLLFIGYFTVGTVLGAKSLADLFGVSYAPMAVTVGIASILIAVFGYNLLHSFGKWVTRISIVILVVVSVYAFVYGAGDAAATTLSGGEYWLAWLLQFTVVFSYTMSWAPYASDYSRYLPVRTSTSKIFGWAFAGLFLSTTWMMALGAFLATLNADGGVLGALGIVLPAVLLKIVLIGLGIAAIPHNAVNLYSGAMASLTYDLPIRRANVATLAGILGCVLALVFGGDDFQQNFEAFLFLVSYFVMPWLAILCADYFRTHSAGTNYPEVQTFYDKRGAFGGINWPGFGGFVTGIVVSTPFMATDLYHRPIGDALGGADVSYFVSFLVAGGVYLTFRRSAPHLAAHR